MLLTVLLALAVGGCAMAYGSGEAVAFATVARGEQSGVRQPMQTVIRGDAEWRALWARIAGPRPAAPPAVDFSREMVVAIFAGERRTSGYAIEVTGVARTDGGLRVSYREGTPAAGDVVRPVLTAPYHVIRLPRVAGPVEMVGE